MPEAYWRAGDASLELATRVCAGAIPPGDETKQLLESLARQPDSQGRQLSFLKLGTSSHSQVGGWPSVDNDDSDSASEGASEGASEDDSEDDSTKPKSAYCRKRTAPEEALLGRLKFTPRITTHHPIKLLRNRSARWMQ
ncbi:hypothetical protein CEP53_003881 [Fusarium sp. AF-6]|nr:hypothetical protein CEP53_003881 [Fusarium sp. AF-6]